MSVFQELFKSPKDTDVTREDQIALVNLCGRTIGHTKDGKREYVVCDGKVFIRGQAGGSVDYFEFCRAVRAYDQQAMTPDSVVLDFDPANGFHLGWPKPQGETAGPGHGGLGQPMQPKPRDTPWAGRIDRSRATVPKSATSGEAGGVPPPFELVNDDGGHGGPHFGLFTATHKAADLLMSGSSSCIHIVPRDNRVLDARNAVRRVFKHEGVAMYQDHPAMNAQPVAELIG